MFGSIPKNALASDNGALQADLTALVNFSSLSSSPYSAAQQNYALPTDDTLAVSPVRLDFEHSPPANRKPNAFSESLVAALDRLNVTDSHVHNHTVRA
jgi:hypothetical protein